MPLPKASPTCLTQLMQVGGFQNPALNFQPWCQAPHRERKTEGLGSPSCPHSSSGARPVRKP